MEDLLRDLRRVLDEGRAPTQNAVLRSLIRGHYSGREIAKDTGLGYNSVNIALHHLVRKGLVERVGRGFYRPRENVLCLALMNKIACLEKRQRRIEKARNIIE